MYMKKINNYNKNLIITLKVSNQINNHYNKNNKY